ncbi:MAG TPA: hypothetical protein VKU36_00335 [Candidatus Babeliales bacterium]|jgi:hypothetical protein|nr:hypothetical protein [Candidatus Babeliales bacterium]
MTHRFILFSFVCTLFSHSINANSFQEKNNNASPQDNLIISIQKELKTPQYRKNVLPHDFSHFSRLITFGTDTQQPPAYLRSIIKLFSNMLKSSHYVNAHAFSQLLETLPQFLAPYFSLHQSQAYITDSALYDATFVDRFKATVNTMLYAKFSNEYDAFRQDPDLFLQHISSHIVAMAHEELVQEQLRQSMIRFCEIALSKLVWNPIAQEETWHITKKIAEQLATFLEYNILDDTNDLDDLHWTLLNRYCYFIELTTGDMPAEFYQAVRSDMQRNDIVLFALQEQDYIVEPKRSYMQRTLLEAETSVLAQQIGLAQV